MRIKNGTFIFWLLLLLTSCGGHLPKDIGPNPAIQSLHQMEFDVTDSNGVSRKEIGIANIFIKENSDFNKISVTIYGIYKGTLNVSSNACGINLNRNFDGKTKFVLSEIIPRFNTKCSIKLTATTDQLRGKEHNIVETGLMKINIIPQEMTPLSFDYVRNMKLYSYIGQGSIQRQEGDLTSAETVTVKTRLKDGGTFRIVGCGHEYLNSFEKNNFSFSFKDIYKKTSLKNADSCDFEVIVIPYREAYSHVGRFSVNIYGSSVVILEPLDWVIDRSFGTIYINATGREYVVACSINDSFEIKKSKKNVKCKSKYDSNEIYWLRSVTANGRKSIIAVKDGEVIWSE